MRRIWSRIFLVVLCLALLAGNVFAGETTLILRFRPIESGVCAIPIDLPEADMEGCIHTMKNGYTKNAAREFINMLHAPATLWKEITLPNG